MNLQNLMMIWCSSSFFCYAAYFAELTNRLAQHQGQQRQVAMDSLSPGGRAMNAIKSCLKVYKEGKGRQLKLDTFFNQHPKAEDLVCTTAPTPETPWFSQSFFSTPSHILSKMKCPNILPGTDRRETPW